MTATRAGNDGGSSGTIHYIVPVTPGIFLLDGVPKTAFTVRSLPPFFPNRPILVPMPTLADVVIDLSQLASFIEPGAEAAPCHTLELR